MELVAFGRKVNRPYPLPILYIGVVARGYHSQDPTNDVVQSLPMPTPTEAIFQAHALRGLLLEQELGA